MAHDLTGGCLCGAVRYCGRWRRDALRECHCGQCRRWSGHIHVADKGDDHDIADGLPQYPREASE